MKKLFLVFSIAVSSFGFGQKDTIVIRITAEEADRALAVVATDIDLEPIKKELFDRVNQYRIENNLPALIYDSLLQNAATFLVTDMANKEYVSHDAKTDTLRFLKERIKYFTGKEPKYQGENCAGTSIFHTVCENHSFSESTFLQYKKSAGHNYIMLYKEFTKVGISLIRIGHNDIIYSVLTFSN